MLAELQLSGRIAEFTLPIHYNPLIQGAIYHSLSPEMADFLHNKGYMLHNRRFPLFVFSRLLGSCKTSSATKTITFTGPIRLLISSPVPEFIHDIAQLMLRGGIRIGNQSLTITSLGIRPVQVHKNRLLVRTLSPIVAYSTFFRSDGRKYTHYFSPYETDFRRITEANLVRKGKILYGEHTEFAPISIRPVGSHRQHVMMYRNIVVKGYSGEFILEGDSRLLQIALEAGVGSKNASGCGMIENCSWTGGDGYEFATANRSDRKSSSTGNRR